MKTISPDEEVDSDIVEALDAVASALRSALGSKPVTRAARDAKVESRTLDRFLKREQKSMKLSTLVRVARRNGIALEIRVGDPSTRSRRPRS